MMDGASEHHSARDIVKMLGDRGDWETTYKCCIEDLEGLFISDALNG